MSPSCKAAIINMANSCYSIESRDYLALLLKVGKTKQRVHDDLFAQLDSSEGQIDLYRLERQVKET